jgi:hypothetical protein
MVELIFIGMLYEIFIIILASIMLILIFKKYLIKRHRLTLILLIIFINWTLGIVFSCLSKVLVIYYNIDYAYNASAPDPGTLISWIILRIVDFRITFIFVTIGSFFSYILKINVFEESISQKQKYFIYIFGIFTVLYSLIIYVRGNTLLDVFAFLFVFLYMSIIYIPFFKRSFKMYQSVEDPTYKNAFLSLAVMSLFIMLVMFNFLIDRILILFGDPGFTFFYFLGWSCIFMSMVCAYLGYIKPKSK